MSPAARPFGDCERGPQIPGQELASRSHCCAMGVFGVGCSRWAGAMGALSKHARAPAIFPLEGQTACNRPFTSQGHSSMSQRYLERRHGSKNLLCSGGAGEQSAPNSANNSAHLPPPLRPCRPLSAHGFLLRSKKALLIFPSSFILARSSSRLTCRAVVRESKGR